MAIQNTDLILVGRAGGSFSTPASELQTFIQGGDSVTYRGTADFTATPVGQIDPPVPVTGDLYINTTAGTVEANWTGAGGSATLVGDRIIWDGSAWELISSGAQDVGVVSIEAAGGATDPITVGGTDAEVTLTVKDATVAQTGVNNLASTPDAAGVIATDGMLIKEHYDDLLGRIGVAAGGGVQSITGDNGISTSGTDSVTVSGVDATTADVGVVQLATNAEVEAGTNTTKAVTAAGVASGYVPLDLSKLTALG